MKLKLMKDETYWILFVDGKLMFAFETWEAAIKFVKDGLYLDQKYTRMEFK